MKKKTQGSDRLIGTPITTLAYGPSPAHNASLPQAILHQQTAPDNKARQDTTQPFSWFGKTPEERRMSLILRVNDAKDISISISADPLRDSVVPDSMLRINYFMFFEYFLLFGDVFVL
jgi:hypothetical protein